MKKFCLTTVIFLCLCVGVFFCNDNWGYCNYATAIINESSLLLDKNESGYYMIKTSEDFEFLRSHPNEKYVICNDIDFNNSFHTPILLFSGVLDGLNYKVTNFIINSNLSNVGFFSEVKNGTIKNVGFQNFTIFSKDSERVGAFAGNFNNYATIENCYSVGKIKVESKKDLKCGGLIGSSSGSREYTIKNCFANNDIDVVCNENAYVGGLAGYFSYTQIPAPEIAFYTPSIFNSYSNSKININSKKDSLIAETYAGGLVGNAIGGGQKIYNSFASGIININSKSKCSIANISNSSGGFYYNCYTNLDFIIIKNNKYEKQKKQSDLPEMGLIDIVKEYSKTWDNKYWKFDDTLPILCNYRNIQVNKIIIPDINKSDTILIVIGCISGFVMFITILIFIKKYKKNKYTD